MEHTRAFLAYDTLCRIAAEIPEDGEQLLEQCEEEAHGLERTLSMFDPDSELSRLCRDIRPGEAVPVSETLYTFLEQNLEICRLSSGAFDPTVGPVVKLWDFLSQTPRIPSAERIRAVLDRLNSKHKELLATRYIDGHNWEFTACRVGLSRRQTIRVSVVALTRLGVLLQDEPQAGEILARARDACAL